MESSFRTENLHFLDDCTAFQNLTDPIERGAKFQDIYQEYLRKSAAQEVNLTSQIIDKLESCAGATEIPDDSPAISGLQEARHHVYLAMTLDSFQSFKRDNPSFESGLVGLLKVGGKVVHDIGLKPGSGPA